MELKDNEQQARAYKRGDREVLHRLYEAYHDDVEQMLRHGFTFTSGGKTVRFRGCRRPFRLREMVQDGFIHAFRDRVRDNYDPSQSFRPYLMTVIRNHMIDQFRRQQLERELFVAADEVAEPDEHQQDALDRLGDDDEDEESPEEDALRRELADLLHAFIEDLDETDETIVRRYMLGDMTQHEMADHLETSRNTVRKRIRMIRRELLGHLKREGFIGRSDVDDVLRDVATLGLIGATP
ncbi:MAG: RNA polymerase sigma factor [Bradymonadaceae bacterium]